MSFGSIMNAHYYPSHLKMATVSIDYGSKGDVELILKTRETNILEEDQAQAASRTSEVEESAQYRVGPLCIKIERVIRWAN